MGLIDWIKQRFSNNKNNITSIEEEETTPFFNDMVNIIHVNPNVYLAHKAARLCVGKDVDDDIDKRMSHLSTVIGVNKHESVAEHTNVIALYKIPKEYINEKLNDYIEFTSNLKYCNYSVSSNDESIFIFMLVGGSARAFMHLIRETSIDNYFINYAKETIYSAFEKCFFKSLLDDDLLDEERCTYLPDSNIVLVKSKVTQTKNQYEDKDVENYDADGVVLDPVELNGERVDVVYMSPIQDIYKKIFHYGFGLTDIYKVATISFLFHDISRTCSHQLVRHRNAISQESQRYVLHDYTMEDFVNPVILNSSDRYSDKRFKEVLEKTNSIVNRNLNDFKWLIDHRVAKEDARAFLPSNITTKLMMTMTYKNFAAFLKLRLDKAAQKEIRMLAEECSTVIDINKLEAFINFCTTPYTDFFIKKKREEMILQQQLLIDETIEEEIEPTSMEINTQEKAQDLLTKQEIYRSMEKKEKEL